MAVILPLCDVGCHCLIRYNQRAHRLQYLTHLTVVILDSTTAVLTEHQSADTVVGRVDTTIMVLHVVLIIVRTCTTLWYWEYQRVVLIVPWLGIDSTKHWSSVAKIVRKHRKYRSCADSRRWGRPQTRAAPYRMQIPCIPLSFTFHFLTVTVKGFTYAY